MAERNVPEPPREDARGKARENERAQEDEPVREQRIITDPEEDFKFSDDLAFEETFGDPTQMTLGMRIVTTLVVVGILAMVGYLVLLVLYPDRFGPEDWIGKASPKQSAGADTAPLKGFQLGGIHLGLPADEALRVYPSMTFTANPQGGRIGAYRHHEGEYRVFFHGLEKSARAYRIESRHDYTQISYLELLTELSQRYGQPTGSGCGAEEKIVSIECTMVWKYPTVRLTAKIKTTVSDDGSRASTALGVTAIDLRSDSFFERIRTEKPKRSLRDIGGQ